MRVRHVRHRDAQRHAARPRRGTTTTIARRRRREGRRADRAQRGRRRQSRVRPDPKARRGASVVTSVVNSVVTSVVTSVVDGAAAIAEASVGQRPRVVVVDVFVCPLLIVFLLSMIVVVAVAVAVAAAVVVASIVGRAMRENVGAEDDHRGDDRYAITTNS